MLRRCEGEQSQFGWLSLGLLIAIIGGTIWWMTPQMIGGCGGRAKEMEGRTYVGAMIRGQQAFFLDNNRFSDDLTALGLGLDQETENYSYHIENHGDRAFNFGEAKEENGVESHYISAVFQLDTTTTVLETGEEIPEFATIICTVDIDRNSENILLTNLLPSLENGIPTCHPDTVLMGRSPEPQTSTISEGLN